MTIFQRTAPWVSPTPEYHDDVPEGKHWLLNHVPFYAKWYRFAMFWRMAEGILAGVKKDPNWPDQRLSISAKNDELRKMLTRLDRGALRRRQGAAREGDPRLSARREADPVRQRQLDPRAAPRRTSSW